MQTEVVTFDLTESLDLADDIMRLGRIRHLPVVSKGLVVGMLSQRDLFRAASSSLLGFGREAAQAWLSHIQVANVMASPVTVIAPDEPIEAAVSIMLERKIGGLPVVEAGKLVGLLSETDCLRHLQHLLGIARTKECLPELPGTS